jgi:alkyl sulfatase BDS1-like metallo-beta-lactamase superfamily hydrolase
MGYQAESGPWRNFYLTGAQELRKGVAELPTPNTASPDTIEAMSLEMVFDYAGVRLDSAKAGEANIRLNFDFGDEGKYLVELENGVLNHTKDVQADDAGATVTLPRSALNKIMLGEETLDQATSSGEVKVTGDAAKLTELVSYLDKFEFWFNIVTP